MRWPLSACLLWACGPSSPSDLEAGTPEPGARHRIVAGEDGRPRAPWDCGARGASLDCFVPVPAGTYVVGAQASDPGAPGYDPLASGGELAVQTVSTPGFWIQKHEVTTASFRLCKECMAHGVLEDEPGNLGLPDRMNHPVNGVSWHAAQAYCAFLGARLPTEVEWELHARGPDARRWPWGDEPGCGVAFVRGDQVPWTERMARPPCDTHGTTVLSGLRGDTVFGTVGAAANVAEWTASSWTDGSARRVVRGGSFMNRDAGDLRGAARDGLPPDAQLLDVGFRCLWQPTP